MPKRFVCRVVAIASSLALLGASTQSTRDLTSAQAEDVHSRLYGGTRAGAIDLKLAGTSGDVYLDPPVHVDAKHPRSTAADFWGMLDFACFNQLVATGRAISGTTHITADRGFLYTDWTIVLDEVVRATAKPRPISGSAVTLVWLGGELQVNVDATTRLIHAVDPDRVTLHAGGQYLLIVGAVPQTGAYSGGQAFELLGNQVVAGTQADPHWTVDTSTTVQLV